MFEVISKHKHKILKSNILNELNIESQKYILVSCHREENVDNENSFNKIINSLNKLAEYYKYPIIFSTHPRTKKIIQSRKPKMNKLIRLIEPFGFIDYNNLQINSFVVLSDSGTISEESSILNFKAINIRESHERPEAMEEASVIMSGLSFERIFQSIESIKDQDTGEKRNILLVNDYNYPNVSIKVERILISYIDYVNRVVWQKES
jgi:UDP-N-acetylglucosamine 2-epimerase (non-hydrolysing)